MRIEYYVGGAKRRVTVPAPRPAAGPLAPAPPDSKTGRQAEALASAPAGADPRPVPLATRTLSLGDARTAEVTWLHDAFGFDVVAEGRHGKVLLAAPPDAADPVRLVERAAVAVYERGVVGSAQPNFLRLLAPPAPAVAEAAVQWGLDNPGDPGVAGADVAAEAAWTITEGAAGIRLAVLDDGVDTAHRHLGPAVVAEHDAVDDHPTAAPDGTDAHGTRCAGIAVGRGADVRGLAPGVGLVACRVMKSTPAGWVLDDFDIADAVDWCWDDAAADVLSNSWALGESDLVAQAFDRARTQGRGGRGAVVVVAAGNDQGRVRFPASLPEILTVGATNEWDERKTTTSRDGERGWGSNTGTGLDLMAPGVHILTTDRTGPGRPDPTVGGFHGTSAATPFVAAAAALVLSVAPGLAEAAVRAVLTDTADPLGEPRRLVGAGRVNVFRALRAARRVAP
jgi:thermitase